MCKHCKTVIEIIRDAEITVVHPGDLENYDAGAHAPYVYLDFERYKSRPYANRRARQLGEAMLKICGNRAKDAR